MRSLIAGSEAEEQTIVTFEILASRYDDLFSRSRIGIQRAVVWEAMAEVFRAGDAILLLNCRTGEDATFLALLDVSVVARDSVEDMTHTKRRRSMMFDGVLLNLSGLNAVVDLDQTARQLSEWRADGFGPLSRSGDLNATFFTAVEIIFAQASLGEYRDFSLEPCSVTAFGLRSTVEPAYVSHARR